MPQFSYKARDRGGKLITGEMEGANRSEIAGRIGGMGYIPVFIQATTGKTSLIPTGIRRNRAGARKFPFPFWVNLKIKPKDCCFSQPISH